jgi:hypothetical protein
MLVTCRYWRARSKCGAPDLGFTKKMTPESRGQVWEDRFCLNPVAPKVFSSQRHDPIELETGIRKIAVADRDPGVSH